MKIRLGLLLAGLLALTACASAGKRLEQGMEAEAEGDYHTAVSRYVQALDKDPDLPGARDALLEAWDAARIQGSAFARDAAARGRPVEAAEEIRALDGLVADARAVGVALPTPEPWPTFRRETLDGAIAALMTEGDALGRDRRWRDARNAYRRIIDDMDPLAAQRRASLDAQADALLAWAEDEFLERRYRAAYLRAGEALTVSRELPADVADAATSLQERALSAGLRVLAVLPVESTDEVGRAALTDLEGPLEDVLETEHWRRPPFFVAVADPASVRRLARRFSPPGTAPRPRRVLEEAGADFGALIELVELRAEERDVKATQRTARTASGGTATYTVEEGRIRYELVAEVTLFDERGSRLESFEVRASDDQGFRRARFEGDLDSLELSRSERLLFNPGEERRQRATLQESLLGTLGGDLAEQIYRRVVDLIP